LLPTGAGRNPSEGRNVSEVAEVEVGFGNTDGAAWRTLGIYAAKHTRTGLPAPRDTVNGLGAVLRCRHELATLILP
jgi:hypothetical protein